MSEERDIVTFTDENGNEIELEVLDYFFYNGQEYAVLTNTDDEGCDCCEHGQEKEHEHGENCECEQEQELYIMKVVQLEDDMEEFEPVEEELMDTLSEIVQQRFDEMDDEDDD